MNPPMTPANVDDGLLDGRYKNNVSTVQKPRLPPELRLTASQMTNSQMSDLPRIKAGYDNAMQEYMKAQDQYRVEQNRIENRFEDDCAHTCGVQDHKNRGKLWRLAWEHGHSAGLSEVWLYYQEFAELLK